MRVPGVGVSRLHAEIIAEQGAFRLRDCSSKFGTYVNGERKNEHVLAHGDRIRLGESEEIHIVFLTADDEPSLTRSADAAALELRHMAGLLDGLRALSSGRVLDDVLTLVLDTAIDVTGAERGFIMLANPSGQLDFKLGRERGGVSLPGRTFLTSRKIPETVFATGREKIVENLLDDSAVGLHSGTIALGIRYVLCTPLKLVRCAQRPEDQPEQTVTGVLYLDSRERGALRSESVRTALETLTAEAAVAIENANLYRDALESAKYEEDLKIAAAIQQALLPISGRQTASFTVAGASVPCRSIGGDFFDYVDLASGRFGFILGDVSGKGAPAAILSAALLGMFSAEAMYHESAAALVARMNASLRRRAVESRFLTTFYGVLSSDGQLTYCNAGHNPPVLVSRAGVTRLETGGLILGLFEHATFEEGVVQLAPGDVLVCFSDGVTEAVDAAGEEFTDERLLGAIQLYRDKAPQEMLDGLLKDVRAFAGGALPNDDVTIVVLRYDGHPAS